MKKVKMEKGITLVALIITIVVLLILAVASITTITNDGILNYANNAATKYNQSKGNESDTLQHYEDYLSNKVNLGETLSDVRFVNVTDITTGNYSIESDSVLSANATIDGTTAQLTGFGLKLFDDTAEAKFSIKNFSTTLTKEVSISYVLTGEASSYSNINANINGNNTFILEPGEEETFEFYVSVSTRDGLGAAKTVTANITITETTVYPS